MPLSAADIEVLTALVDENNALLAAKTDVADRLVERRLVARVPRGGLSAYVITDAGRNALVAPEE